MPGPLVLPEAAGTLVAVEAEAGRAEAEVLVDVAVAVGHQGGVAGVAAVAEEVGGAAEVDPNVAVVVVVVAVGQVENLVVVEPIAVAGRAAAVGL